jgi:hypothetical protein
MIPIVISGDRLSASKILLVYPVTKDTANTPESDLSASLMRLKWALVNRDEMNWRSQRARNEQQSNISDGCEPMVRVSESICESEARDGVMSQLNEHSQSMYLG